MHLKIRKNWELPESAVTPEADYRLRPRRDFLRTLGAGVAGTLFPSGGFGATAGFPSELNPKFDGADMESTPYELITSYNNFYEFGTAKDDPKEYANRGWQTEPWTIELTGRCRNPGRHDVNALIKQLGGIEQRIYRMRCVEAWSMVIPWDGFALSKLIAFAQPHDDAKFVQLTSFLDKENAIGQRRGNLPYPYVEGLRMDEAMNELTFIATGIYGKPIPNQNGAPLRLVVPWKYGFKGIKSIVEIEFTSRQPRNTWSVLAPREYGFYANVNPEVDHPRWSQASERVIGGGFFSGKKPTLMFNGYEEQVAGLYDGMDLRKHF